MSDTFFLILWIGGSLAFLGYLGWIDLKRKMKEDCDRAYNRGLADKENN